MMRGISGAGRGSRGRVAGARKDSDRGSARRPPGPARLLAATLALAAFGSALPCEAAWRQTWFLIGGYGVNAAPFDPARLVLLDAAGLDLLWNHDHQIDLGLGRRLAEQVDSLRRARPGFQMQVVLFEGFPESVVGHFTTNHAVAARWGEVRKRLAYSTATAPGAVLGWSIWDEPCTRADFTQIDEFVHRLHKEPGGDDRIPYVNLLPIAEPGTKGCYEATFGKGLDRRAAYAAYLDAYLSIYDDLPQPAPLLSFDSFPFQEDHRVGVAWFENLRVARERTAARARVGVPIPFWVVIQLAFLQPEHGRRMRTPTPAQVRWQAWTAVAYGAKSIGYWTVGTSAGPETGYGYHAGLLELNGRPSVRYETVRNLDAELHALGPTLMDLEPIGVFHVDPGGQQGVDDERLDAAGAGRPVVRVTGEGAADCMIGSFRGRKDGWSYLLVVNKSMAASRRFRLELASAPPSIDRFDTKSGAPIRVAPTDRFLDVGELPAVSGRLFRLGVLPAGR